MPTSSYSPPSSLRGNSPHGRLPQSQTLAPVLTGAPVAGMVYLDRPNPAGYFIFPDLSVRHEGKYRLSFSLYEDVKDDKDVDFEPVEGSPVMKGRTMANSAVAPRAHVHFRLEVKSIPFDVFSAKKFPGLSESTVLSRQVAEQGCRVRIRRDIRVRRRDNKPSEGYQNNGDEGHYGVAERYSTPQHMPERQRSISNGSVDAATPYLGRRSSVETAYYPQNNYQPAPPPCQPRLLPIPPHTSTLAALALPHTSSPHSRSPPPYHRRKRLRITRSPPTIPSILLHTTPDSRRLLTTTTPTSQLSSYRPLMVIPRRTRRNTSRHHRLDGPLLECPSTTSLVRWGSRSRMFKTTQRYSSTTWQIRTGTRSL